jgi:hypothetical protein
VAPSDVVLSVPFLEQLSAPRAAGLHRFVPAEEPPQAGQHQQKRSYLNPAGAVESRSIQRLPGRLSLSAKLVTRVKKVKNKIVKTHLAKLSGSLTENHLGVSGNAVLLHGVGTVMTGDGGKFSRTVPIKHTTYFTASAIVGRLGDDRDFTPTGCTGASIAPAGCVNATLWNFGVTSPTVKVTVLDAKK